MHPHLLLAAAAVAAVLPHAAGSGPDITFTPSAFDSSIQEGPHEMITVELTHTPTADVTVSWVVHEGPIDVAPASVVFAAGATPPIYKQVWLRRHKWLGFWWGVDMPCNISTVINTTDPDYAPLAAVRNISFPTLLTEKDPPPTDGIEATLVRNPSEDGTLGAVELTLKTRPMHRNYTDFTHDDVGVWVYAALTPSYAADVVVPDAAPPAPRMPGAQYAVAAYFPAGEWQKPQRAHFRATDDTRPAGDVAFTATFLTDSDDPRYMDFVGVAVGLTRLDDDDHHYYNCTPLAEGAGMRCASAFSDGEVCNARTIGECEACCEARRSPGCCEWRAGAGDVDAKALALADMCYFHPGLPGPGSEGVVAVDNGTASHARMCRKYISLPPRKECVGADYLPTEVAIASNFSLTLHCRHHTDNVEAVYLSPTAGVCNEDVPVFLGDSALDTVMPKYDEDAYLNPRFWLPGVYEPGEYQVCLKKLSDNTSHVLQPPLTVLPATRLEPYVTLQEGIASGGAFAYEIAGVGDVSHMRFGLSRHRECFEPELLGVNDTTSLMYVHDGRTVMTRTHEFVAPGRYWSCAQPEKGAPWAAHAAFSVPEEPHLMRRVSTVPEFPRARQGFRLVLFGESLGNLTPDGNTTGGPGICKVTRIDPSGVQVPCADSNTTAATWNLFEDKTLVCDFDLGVDLSGWYTGCFAGVTHADATFMVRERNVSRVYATSVPAVPTTREFFTVLVRGEREWQDGGVVKITDDVTCESDHWVGAWNTTRTTNNYAHIHRFLGPTLLLPPYTEVTGTSVPTADNLCVHDRRENAFNLTGAPFSVLYACPIADVETQLEGERRLGALNVNQHDGYVLCGFNKGWAFAVDMLTQTQADCNLLSGNYTSDSTAWGTCKVGMCRAQATSCFADGAPEGIDTKAMEEEPLCGLASGLSVMGLGECLSEYAFVTRALLPVPFRHSCQRLHGRYMKSRAACLLDVCDVLHIPSNYHRAFDLPDTLDSAPGAPAAVSTPPELTYSPVWVSDPITVNLPGYPIFACFRAKHERFWRWLGGFATEDSCAVKRAKLCRDVRCTADETVIGQCWLEGAAWGGLGTLRGPANFVRTVCEQMVCAEGGAAGKLPMPVFFEQELPLLRHPAFTVSPDGSEVRVHYSAHAHNLALVDAAEEVYVMTNPLPLDMNTIVTFAFQFQAFAAKDIRIGLVPLAQTDPDPMGPGPVYNSSRVPLHFETPINSTVVHDPWTPDHNCSIDGEAWYRFKFSLTPPAVGIYEELANGTSTVPTCVPLDAVSLLEFHNTGWRVVFVMRTSQDGILPITDMARINMRP